LLAQLHLDSLKGKWTPKAIRIALAKLPTGSSAYDETYHAAMERVEGQADAKKLAKQVLSWITCAKRQLTLSELQHALAVEVGEPELDEENLPQIEDMISVCAGLVTADEESKIIRLVHYTTQEYFERTWPAWFPDAQTDITGACVTYLSFNTFETEDFKAILQSNVLYNYAARNWGHHARTSSIEGTKLILNLLESETKVSACSQEIMLSGNYWYPYHGQTHMTGAHLAAFFGLEKSMTVLLSRQHDPNSKDINNWTPLSWAAHKGHEAVVKLLVDEGADLNSKDNQGRTPLLLALDGEILDRQMHLMLLEQQNTMRRLTTARQKQDNMAHADDQPLMPRQQALPPGTFPKGSRVGASSLLCSPGREAVVQFLVDKGADLESTSWAGHTPLSWVAMLGYERLAKLLVNKGANLNSKDDKGRTPLSRAACHGHEAVVKLLVDEGADLNSRDDQGLTPLSWAVMKGHETVVQLLVDKGLGADLEPKVSMAGRRYYRPHSADMWATRPSDPYRVKAKRFLIIQSKH
jgi:ankyrin repeat protein